jgi:hypothetical protein
MEIAMDDEFKSLLHNETWKLVDLLKCGFPIINDKWVYKLKLKFNANLNCYKARLIAHGFT